MDGDLNVIGTLSDHRIHPLYPDVRGELNTAYGLIRCRRPYGGVHTTEQLLVLIVDDDADAAEMYRLRLMVDGARSGQREDTAPEQRRFQSPHRLERTRTTPIPTRSQCSIQPSVSG